MDVAEYWYIGYFVVAIVLAYQLYVTFRVTRATEYSRTQKLIQMTLIWVLPVLGAGLCHAVLYTMTDRSRPTDKKYLEDDPLDGLNVRPWGRERSHHRDKEPDSEGHGADGGD